MKTQSETHFENENMFLEKWKVINPFFNSQPKTLTEKEASAFIESSSMYNEDYKNVSHQVLGNSVIRSGSPTCDNSNTG